MQNFIELCDKTGELDIILPCSSISLIERKQDGCRIYLKSNTLNDVTTHYSISEILEKIKKAQNSNNTEIL